MCDLAYLTFLSHSSLVHKAGPMKVTCKGCPCFDMCSCSSPSVLEAFAPNVLYCIYLGNWEESNRTLASPHCWSLSFLGSCVWLIYTFLFLRGMFKGGSFGPVVGHWAPLGAEHALRLGHNYDIPCTPWSMASQLGRSLIFAENFVGFLSIVADG